MSLDNGRFDVADDNVVREIFGRRFQVDLMTDADKPRVAERYLRPVREIQVLFAADMNADMLKAHVQYLFIDFLEIGEGILLEVPGRDDLIGC